MFDSVKRLLAGGDEGADWRAISAWESQRGARFKRSRDGAGFVVEGRFEASTWRLEWGPPQRSYIAGHELRLRMELGLPQELNMLVLSRPLMEALERSAFEQYTAQMQTRIDDTTPEEMRWLAMFPKLKSARSISCTTSSHHQRATPKSLTPPRALSISSITRPIASTTPRTSSSNS